MLVLFSWFFHSDGPSEEEEEVCIMLQDCLDLRKKYVFRERVAPWDTTDHRQQEENGIRRSDPGNVNSPKPNQHPFLYKPEPASKVFHFSFSFKCLSK